MTQRSLSFPFVKREMILRQGLALAARNIVNIYDIDYLEYSFVEEASEVLNQMDKETLSKNKQPINRR